MILWGCALALVVYSVADVRGFRHAHELSVEIDGLQKKNADLAHKNAELSRRIHALRKDPEAIRRAAREQLGFVGPGEIVVDLE